MTISSHVLNLRKKHQELSEEIEEAQRDLATDDLHLTEMNKRKLKTVFIQPQIKKGNSSE